MIMLTTTLLAEVAAPLATLAFFQDVTPKPSQMLPLTSPIVGYIIMALFGAAIISVSLLPSKRGHQD